MTDFKRIVILAKSYKPGGWCVAGKEIEYRDGNIQAVGGWIRPVSGDTAHHGSLTDAQCQLDVGGTAHTYDIIDIPVSGHLPEPGQPENYRIADGVPWRKVDDVVPGAVKVLEDRPDDIWLESGLATDRVSSGFDESGLVAQSLYLVKPEEFTLRLSNDFNAYEERHKRDIRADFSYCDVRYEHLSITDPYVRRAFSGRYPEEDGDYVQERLPMDDNVLICISLGPRFAAREEHYKIVAAILDFTGHYQRSFR